MTNDTCFSDLKCTLLSAHRVARECLNESYFSSPFTLSQPPLSFLCVLFLPSHFFVFPSDLPLWSILPSPPLTHSEILTETLKLAASISAPAQAPEAFEQEAKDASKTSLSNVRARVRTRTRTQRIHSFILIHSFAPGCTTERLEKKMCRQTRLHARPDTHSGREVDRKTGHSGPPPSGCLCQPPLPVLCAVLCKQVTLSYFHLSEWERQAANWLSTHSYHLIIVTHCAKAQTAHATMNECAHTHTHSRMNVFVCSMQRLHVWSDDVWRSSQHTNTRITWKLKQKWDWQRMGCFSYMKDAKHRLKDDPAKSDQFLVFLQQFLSVDAQLN